MRYYLAYGSNLNKEQMKRRCPGAKYLGKSVIPNYRLAFKGYGNKYLTIIPARGHEVPVGIWEIDEDNERALDLYEGYPSFYKKHTFKKIKVPVTLDMSYDEECFAYIMNKGSYYGMPTGTYYMACSQGYKDCNLDDNYLEEALEYSKNKIGEM